MAHPQYLKINSFLSTFTTHRKMLKIERKIYFSTESTNVITITKYI